MFSLEELPKCELLFVSVNRESQSQPYDFLQTLVAQASLKQKVRVFLPYVDFKTPQQNFISYYKKNGTITEDFAIIDTKSSI